MRKQTGERVSREWYSERTEEHTANIARRDERGRVCDRSVVRCLEHALEDVVHFARGLPRLGGDRAPGRPGECAAGDEGPVYIIRTCVERLPCLQQEDIREDVKGEEK